MGDSAYVRMLISNFRCIRIKGSDSAPSLLFNFTFEDTPYTGIIGESNIWQITLKNCMDRNPCLQPKMAYI